MSHIQSDTIGKSTTNKKRKRIYSLHCLFSSHSYCSTRWYSNRYVNGAYSFISTKCDKNETISHNILGKALTIENFHQVNQSYLRDDEQNGKTSSLPVVFFAGEACHEKYFSTAHGAFLSGFEQAQRIVELNKQATI